MTGRVTVRRRTLDMLAGMARAGALTPTNDMIRRVCGFASEGAVSVMLAQLGKAGEIRREGDAVVRRFWVADVGAWTGWATVRDGHEAAAPVVKPATKQVNAVAARAVADRLAPAAHADGVARGAVSGGAASPVPAETPADVGASAGEPTYHSGVRARRRREVMAAQVLDVLIEAAEAGAPCPKNGALCAAFKGSASEVGAVLARLKEAGSIAVERDGKRRRVTILAQGRASGRATDWSLPDERGIEVMPQHMIEARAAEDADIAARRDAVEAERAARQRAALAAEEQGRVPAPIALQAMALADRASRVGAALQGAWPDTWRLLVRLSVAESVRPMVLIDRLIRAEAARVGVKTPALRHAPEDEDDEDVAVMDALNGVDHVADVIDEGNWG